MICLICMGALSEYEQDVKEKEIDWEELPPAVQETILAEAGDYPVTELEEISAKGETFYEAEWLEGDNEVEILVAVDGKLLDREIEPQDDEDADEDEEADAVEDAEEATEDEKGDAVDDVENDAEDDAEEEAGEDAEEDRG